MKLKPIIKWTGGKRREIKKIEPYLPNKIDRYVEPFVGGGALFFYLNNQNSIINDYEFDVYNFYNFVDDDEFNSIINEWKNITDHDEMERQYYYFRDNPFPDDDRIRAAQFVYINQLAFSGMRRFNKQGKFNVPFGHYKSFNPKITIEQRQLLSTTIVKNESAMNIIGDYDDENTFIFLDPPYTRTFKTYSAGSEFGENEQIELFECLDNIKNAKWMLIINEDDFILSLYKNYFINSYPLKYGVNIKNRFSTDVKHLVIRNYNESKSNNLIDFS